MNLDDLERFHELDQKDMLGHIDALPEQIEAAWQHAQTLEVPTSFGRVDKIVICGMGGSAMGGDLLTALVEDECNVPIIVNRDGTLPSYVDGQDTLVIALSYSGNTSETLAAFELANQRGTQLLAITTGGRLAELATQNGVALWRFEYESQPRAALGWTFTLLIAALVKTGLVADKANDIATTIDALRRRRKVLTSTNIIPKNPAKRLAGQLVDRMVIIYGAGFLGPVARRWKTQLNENGKCWAHFEVLPELNHNAVAGILFPEKVILQLALIQLTAPELESADITARHDATRQLLLEQGIAMDPVKARGKSRLENMMNSLQFGDYVSWYVAMANGVDPTPVTPIDMLKEKLARATDLERAGS